MPASLRELPKKHLQTKLHSFLLDILKKHDDYIGIFQIRGGGGARTRANSVCFTKNLVKIGAYPNATPTSKIWRNLSVDQKDQRRRSVWVGHADFFQNDPEKTKIH